MDFIFFAFTNEKLVNFDIPSDNKCDNFPITFCARSIRSISSTIHPFPYPCS